MKIEKAIAAALEPIADLVVSLQKQFDEVKLKEGPAGKDGKDAPLPDVQEVAKLIAAAMDFTALKGADGKDGRDGQDGAAGRDGTDGKDVSAEDVAKILALQHSGLLRGSDGRDGSAGRDGNDGAGIEAKQFVAGDVYRAGTIVTANLGQHFRAKRDTADPTDTVDSWERIGTGGFRHRGNFDKDIEYSEGDLYRKDFSTFGIINGKAELLAGRGAKGEQGPTGEVGRSGKDGRDGSTIVAVETKGFVLSLTFQNSDGSLDNATADFTDAFKEAIAAALGELHGA